MPVAEVLADQRFFISKRIFKDAVDKILMRAVFELNYVAARSAVSAGAQPLELLELAIRSRDVIRVSMVLSLLPPAALNRVRRIALQVRVFGNYPAELGTLKNWVYCQRSGIRAAKAGRSAAIK